MRGAGGGKGWGMSPSLARSLLRQGYEFSNLKTLLCWIPCSVGDEARRAWQLLHACLEPSAL